MKRDVRVLVVEDDADVAHAIRDVLETEGYEVQLAQNGDQALTVCERWQPDAIVLDHNLPVMAGVPFLREIGWHPTLCHVPVLLISALPDLGTIARRLNVQHYLVKPFDPDALASAVGRMIAGYTPRGAARSSGRV